MHDGRIFASGNAGEPVCNALEANPATTVAVRQASGERARSAAAAGALDSAIFGLARAAPELSAVAGLWPWQRRVLLGSALVIGVGLILMPGPLSAVLLIATAVPFFAGSLLRAAAIGALWRQPGGQPLADRAHDPMPSYAVLVPLFREVEVLPRLIGALTALDYPAGRLDIVLILEAADPATWQSLAAMALPPHFRILVVPDAAPRTKPKALNFALATVGADHVVVYDAEDRPEPDQLRRAVAMFRAYGPTLGCLQARLDLYNGDETFLSRQFAIEYAALFDGVLPALARLGLPMPLGGTSNHFPRAVLEAAGGWDAFNVTEDADLGVRLARLGYRVAMLDSRTLEEAPIAPGQWLGQRTRWMKGWLQTFGVHTRDQARLARQLGPLAAAGFHAYMGGLILSALVHPLVYALAIGHGVASLGQGQPTRALVSMVEVVALANLAFGYLTAMALGALAARRRGYEFWRHAMLMPLYWLAISLAAYRAVFELRRAPFWWQKTEHGVSRVSEPAAHPIGGRADQPAR